VEGVVMLTIVIKKDKKTIYKKEIDNFDDNSIEALMQEIDKTIEIGKRFSGIEMNSEAVKQMVEGWK
jgi:hypothetical protein